MHYQLSNQPSNTLLRKLAPNDKKKINFYSKLHSDATSLAESLTTMATQATSSKHLQHMSCHSGNLVIINRVECDEASAA